MSHAAPTRNPLADIALIPQSPSEVAKAITYIALTALGALSLALSDDVVSLVELLVLIIGILGTLPVYLLAGTRAKTIIAFVVAGLQSLVTFLGDSFGFQDMAPQSWIAIILTAFAAIGVAVVPNRPMGTTVSSEVRA